VTTIATLDDSKITRIILDTYHAKFADRIESDVLVVGAGPAGLTAATVMAEAGLKVTVIERKLAPGGGVWGGGMAMNQAVVQDDALDILDRVSVRHRHVVGAMHAVDTVELAAALTLEALHAGVVILNLTTAEDVAIRDGRVSGVVVNRTMISGSLHVDPVTFVAKAVIDGTGHDAAVVEWVRKRGLLRDVTGERLPGELAMDATLGERFVVEHAGEVFPGLWVAGMSVCTAFGGPRMGPIFGGMLLSGQRVGDAIVALLKEPA